MHRNIGGNSMGLRQRIPGTRGLWLAAWVFILLNLGFLAVWHAVSTTVWDDEVNGFFLSRLPLQPLLAIMARPYTRLHQLSICCCISGFSSRVTTSSCFACCQLRSGW